MEAADTDLASAAPSLKDYDAESYGPLLGVSDEGSAAPAIVAAALGSPKASAIPSPSALEIGVAHDGERLGSIGETPIGPDEFEAITDAVAGKILITTNIGSHTASWHYLRGPTADLDPNGSGTAAELSAQLVHYLPAASGGLREVPVYLRALAPDLFARPGPLRDSIGAVRSQLAVPDGTAAAIALLVELAADDDDESVVAAAIELAARSEVAVVALGGMALAPAEGRTNRPGVLNYFGSAAARALLARGAKAGVEVRGLDIVDVRSIANQIWAALATTRRMGAAAGKYSLYPLTFQEMEPVLRSVQGWFSDWTAAPAYYLDLETIDGTDVLDIDDAAAGARRWLEMISAANVPVVLIDTADKAKGRRLLKTGPDDERGILCLSEIRELNQLADERAIKILWAGGIGLDQVHEFGRLGSFGIYVTSAAARRQTITGAYANDPGLAAEREPTRQGVTKTQLQLEAGFLAERVDGGARIGELAVAALEDPEIATQLTDELIGGWRRLWERSSC
ncbi:MAG TPA: hypothetical protein VN458_07100 [Solirubrobacterales bacterium]|nr:hypothetical protein [Solirubrobacterales bacterium]